MKNITILGIILVAILLPTHKTKTEIGTPVELVNELETVEVVFDTAETLEPQEKAYSLSRQGDCSLVYNYDWPADIAYGICMAESRGDPNAANWEDDHSDWAGCYGSFGLMQINCWHGQVFDPIENMNIAYKMWLDWGGFEAWTTYTKGYYLEWL